MIPLRAALPIAMFAAARAAADKLHDDRLELSIFATGLKEPVAIEFAPDGRLFVVELGGTLREVAADGALNPDPVLSIEVFTPNENGLLGLALDPDFTANGYIYVFATIDPKEQRILRIIDPQHRKSPADAEPVIIRDHLPTRGEFHSGGGMKIGPDRKLYFGIGDNLIRENGQDMNTLAGKVSRISLDGTTPSDNPFKTPSGSPRAIYALGFRNPFRFCFAPDGRMFVMDVGSDNEERREEINLVRAGDNCGWPLVEGRRSEAPDPSAVDPSLVDPIYDYHDGGAAPVGCVYYADGNLPSDYAGNLLHLEFVLGRLYRTVLDGDRVVSHTTLLETDGGPIDLCSGPDGAIYFTELYSGQIRRLAARARVASAEAGAQPSDPNATAAGDDRFVILNHGSLCGIGASFALAPLLGLVAYRSIQLRAKPR